MVKHGGVVNILIRICVAQCGRERKAAGIVGQRLRQRLGNSQELYNVVAKCRPQLFNLRVDELMLRLTVVPQKRYKAI